MSDVFSEPGPWSHYTDVGTMRGPSSWLTHACVECGDEHLFTVAGPPIPVGAVIRIADDPTLYRVTSVVGDTVTAVEADDG